MAEDFTIHANLRAYWYFEESASPSLDGTANNNDLVWTGASAQRDTTLFKQGAASIQMLAETANLPTLAHASVASNFPFKVSPTTEFTVGGWVYIPASATGTTIQYYGQAAQGYLFSVEADNTIGGQIRGGALLNSNSTYTTGWNHIVLRWNGENRANAGGNDVLSLWINGTQQTETSAPADVPEVTGGELRMYGYATVQFRFDEWFAFDIALTDTQIADIYAYGLDGTRGGITPLIGAGTFAGTSSILNSGLNTRTAIKGT